VVRKREFEKIVPSRRAKAATSFEKILVFAAFFADHFAQEPA